MYSVSASQPTITFGQNCLQKIPNYWAWYYWACPLAWHIYGSVIAQYGDLNDKFIHVVGEPGMVSIPHFIRKNFGLRHSWLGYTIGVSVIFPTIFAVVYVIAIRTLNFQQR